MGEGSALAMEMSDVTFMDSNLLQLVFSLELGRNVVTTIRQNIALSFGSKIVVVILTFYHRLTLFWAIASDVGIMLLVTLNGMKPLRTGQKPHAIKEQRRRRKRSKKDPIAYNELESQALV